MSNKTRPEHYRHKAERARALAAKLKDQVASLEWLEIAKRYDLLGDMVERLEGGGVSSAT
jgi:hypothetical protein